MAKIGAGQMIIICHSQTYWRDCDLQDHPEEARKQLLQKIVDRVIVYDAEIIAVALHGDFAVVLGQKETASDRIADAVSDTLVGSVLTPM
jgi:hypothetical protein